MAGRPATSPGWGLDRLEDAHEQLREHARVTVVTGGALGIGAAIAEELGRDGALRRHRRSRRHGRRPPGAVTREATTAQRIVAAGGQARASNISVTDADAVRALFAGAGRGVRRARRGRQRRRHQPAHRIRLRGRGRLACGARRAPQRIPQRAPAALPHMAAAGHGRILGVTSGSGWRPADAGAYSCAKRAVAALTWQIGQATPAGSRSTRCRRSPPRGWCSGRSPAGGRRERTGRTRPRAACHSPSTTCPRPSTSGRSARTSRARTFAAGPAGRSCSRTARRSRGWSRPSCSRSRAPPTSGRSRGCSSARAHRARARRGRAGEQRRREPPSRHRVRRGRTERERARRTRRAVVVTDEPGRAPRSRRRSGPRGVECVDHHGSRRRISRAHRSSSRPRPRVGAGRCGGRGARRSAREPARRRRRGVATGARRAHRDHRPDRHRRGLGPRGRRSRGGERSAGPGRHRGRRDDGRRSQPGPRRHAALARRAPGDGRPGGRVRDQRGVRPRVGARPGRGARRVLGERRRRRRAVGGRARGRRRTGSACAAIPAPPGTVSYGGPDVPGWLDGAVREHGRRREPRSDTRRLHGGTDRTHRRRARPPVGSRPRRLVPVPGRPARARHGRHLGHGRPLRPAHLLLGVRELERREVRARRRRDRGSLGRRDRGAGGAGRGHRPPRRDHRRHRARATPSPTPSGCSTRRWRRPVSAASGRWAAGSARRPARSCGRSPSATWCSS